MKYIRTTHVDGIPKGFSPEANEAWHTGEVGFVGHMLSPTEPMTIEQIQDRILDYYRHDPDIDNYAVMPKADIAAVLTILLKHGFAQEVE
jgi:hypothetical protein